MQFADGFACDVGHNTNYQVVRMEGLEPPHLAASDPKSDVSTNFTTSGSAGFAGRKGMGICADWADPFKRFRS